MAYKKLVKSFEKDIKPIEIDGESILIRKFTAYDKILIQKSATENGESHPTTIASIIRGGLVEDVSDLTDRDLLSDEQQAGEITTAILAHNDLSKNIEDSDEEAASAEVAKKSPGKSKGKD